MGILDSHGQIEHTFNAPIDAVSNAIVTYCGEKKHKVENRGQSLVVHTKKTAMSYGTAMNFALSANGPTTAATIKFDNVPGAPGTVVDGRRNRKAAEKFAQEIDARL